MVRVVRLLVAIMAHPLALRVGLAKVISVFIRIVFACQVSPGFRAGRDFTLAYGGLGTIIHGGCRVGDRVTIGANVTLGGNFGKGGVPMVGNDVYIATGAKVLGPVIIGDGVTIAANAVVLSDVEPFTVYGGVPARRLGDARSDRNPA